MRMRQPQPAAARPRVRRLRPPPLSWIAALAVLLLLAAPAPAGSDDFAFGQALAKRGQETGNKIWFDYAKRVFNGILADRNRSQTEQNEARYGLAMLQRGEALAAAANAKVPYDKVRSAFDEAITGIERFVRGNPKHPSLVEAKLHAGETRLNFVQWARDLLEDPERLGDRGANPDQVQQDAREMVEAALAYFGALDDGWDAQEDATEISQIARFHWVTCKYFSALIYPDCSSDALAALQEAGDQLEEFISFFDGQLVAIFAQDFYGLTFWELARCDELEDQKASHYRQAVDWFDTVIQTELTNRDSLRIIARGYLHIAQCCLDAGRIGGENFLKRGRGYLKRMTSSVPPILTTVDGLRATIAWGKIEAQLDNGNRAIEVLTEAKKHAEKSGRIWLVNRANREITRVLAGGGGGSGTTVGPDVLKSVADDQYVAKNYLSAIEAYQKVIQAAGDSDHDLMRFVVPSWQRIAECYAAMGDLLSAALATEPVHAAWMDGRIPRKEGDKNDPNLIAMGNLRARAQKWLKQLFDETGSPAYRKRWTENRDTFSKDYAGHPITEALDYRVALQKYNEAKQKQDRRDGGWKSTLAEAVRRFELVAKDEKSAAQELAQVMLVRCESVRGDWKAMVRRADEALAYWDRPEVKKRAKAQPTIGQRIDKARGKIKFWKSVALVKLKRWDEVLSVLDRYEIQHGDMEKVILSGALGNVVQALLGKGDIERASVEHQRLLRQYPDYPQLPQLTFDLARYYEKRYSALEEKLLAASRALHGTKEDRAAGAKAKWRKAAAEANLIAERLIDLNGERNKAEDFIRYWEEQVVKEKKETRYTEDDYKKAKWRLQGSDQWKKTDREYGRELYEVGILATIEKMNARLKAATAEADKWFAEVGRLEKEIARIRKEMYTPLKKAANFYWDWDQVMKKVAPQKRTARNLKTFAYRFYYATVLNPDDADAWNKARSLYEDYMKKSGVGEEQKASAAAKLGRIYSHLSDVAKDETPRKEFGLKALSLLQDAIARNPQNNAIVVRQLAGDLVVVPWAGRLHEGEQFRFPMPRIQDVAGLRRAVKAMGTDAAPMPKFKDPRAQRHFDDELAQFKRHVAELSDQEAARIVKNFRDAGFDPAFYKRHAKTRPEFRLALARVYARSGRMEDVRKAINLCYSLTSSLLRVPEGSAEWWEAQAIKLGAYLKGAEIGLQSGQDQVKAEAKEMLERAGKSLKNLYANDNSLGEDARPETPGELRALLARMNELRRRMSMSDLGLQLDADAGANDK